MSKITEEAVSELATIIYQDILEIERTTGRYLSKGDRGEFLLELLKQTLERYDEGYEYNITIVHKTMKEHWKTYTVGMMDYWEAFKNVDEEERLK